ncbi:uncharacterized protein V6R79_013038 [Siganus canaliculatus]
MLHGTTSEDPTMIAGGRRQAEVDELELQKLGESDNVISWNDNGKPPGSPVRAILPIIHSHDPAQAARFPHPASSFVSGPRRLTRSHTGLSDSLRIVFPQ